MALAMEFKTWIEVSFERMETLKALELPDVFTTDPGAGRIRVVEQSEICSATLHQWNKEQPTLAILPTSRPLVSFHHNVHVVPYSDHSSYQELEDFVSALKPTTVVPIVGNHFPGSLSALVPSRKRREILVPESVRHYMLRLPKSQPSSSACTSLRQRPFQPIAPKGVIFESPVRGSRKSCEEVWEVQCLEQDISEEEMDTGSSEKDSDCILIDVSRDLVPKKHRIGAGDIWNLNIVKTVSEDVAMAESVPLSQLTQSNLAPLEILTNTKAYLKPVRTTRKPFETKAKTIKETAINYTCQQGSYGNAQNNHTLLDSDDMSQESGNEIDQEDVLSYDKNMSQRSGHSQSDGVQSCLDNESCTSSSSLTVLRQEYLEDIEKSVLNGLPFTETDFKTCGLLQQSFVQQFILCPICDAKNEDMPD